MLENETSTQPVADRLKAIIQRAQPKGRRAAMEALQQFERCGWSPRAFDETAAGRLVMEGDELRYVGDDAVAGITDTLTQYLKLVGCIPAEFPDPMTTQDAARYLGVTVDQIKKLVHRQGLLVPALEGHNLMFSKAILDDYKQNRRRVGRPNKQTEE